MAHGVAGSAALMLIVASSADGFLQGVLYIALFGVGSIVGMMAIGLTLSLPVVWSLTAGRRLFSAVQGFASLSSVGFGLWMLYRLLFAGGE